MDSSRSILVVTNFLTRFVFLLCSWKMEILYGFEWLSEVWYLVRYSMNQFDLITTPSLSCHKYRHSFGRRQLMCKDCQHFSLCFRLRGKSGEKRCCCESTIFWHLSQMHINNWFLLWKDKNNKISTFINKGMRITQLGAYFS